MKSIRIFLLGLIIIGVGLFVTQSIWVPTLVNKIIADEFPARAPTLSDDSRSNLPKSAVTATLATTSLDLDIGPLIDGRIGGGFQVSNIKSGETIRMRWVSDQLAKSWGNIAHVCL